MNAGSYTVGIAGDYATWAEAFAALSSPLVGNVIFTQISSFTMAGAATISVAAMAGFTVTCTSNTHPYGDPTKGWVTTLNSQISCFLDTAGFGGTSVGTFEIKNLNINRTAKTTFLPYYHFYCASTSSNTYKIHDNIFRDNITALGSTTGNIINGGAGGTNIIWQVYNNYFFDSVIACSIARASSASYVENCTAYVATYGASTTGFQSGTYGTFRQCVSFNFGTCYSSTIARSNCASSDTTGAPAALQSLTAATQLQSVDTTKSNFYDILPTGKLWQYLNTATYLSGHTTDIRQRRIPNNRGYHSIGASTAWANQAILTD